MVDKKAIVLLIENPVKVDEVNSAIRGSANSDFKLETANQLNLGLKRLDQGDVDLVLLNLPVNGLTNVEAFMKVKEKADSVPVLVVGGEKEDEKLAAEASRQGLSRWQFQGSENDLLRAIHQTIENSQLKSELAEAKAKLEAANMRLEKLANIDDLTEIFNRSGMEGVLRDEYDRAQRGEYPLIAIALDCDDFDRVNQSLGHRVGDVVLKELVGRMKEIMRPTDHIARTGGDEFLLLLPETRFAEGMLVAEKIRLAVAESPLRLAQETIRITASFGVLALPYDYCSIEELLSLVRLAVNESKGLGKNRVSSGEKHKDS